MLYACAQKRRGFHVKFSATNCMRWNPILVFHQLLHCLDGVFRVHGETHDDAAGARGEVAPGRENIWHFTLSASDLLFKLIPPFKLNPPLFVPDLEQGGFLTWIPLMAAHMIGFLHILYLRAAGYGNYMIPSHLPIHLKIMNPWELCLGGVIKQFWRKHKQYFHHGKVIDRKSVV